MSTTLSWQTPRETSLIELVMVRLLKPKTQWSQELVFLNELEEIPDISELQNSAT